MSLFGSESSSPGVPPLFRDDDDGLTPGGDILRTSSQPVNVSGHGPSSGGLFDDVSDGDIWALPAPRSRSVGPGTSVPGGTIANGGKRGIVKTLINENNSNLPPAYGEVFERMVMEHPAPGFGGGVSAMAVRRVLDEAGLNEDNGVGRRIKEAVMGVGVMSDVGVSRGEFSVLMAMAGLAQEGEEVSIDAVDDRRRNLPVPKLKSLTPSYDQNSPVGSFGPRGSTPPGIDTNNDGNASTHTTLTNNSNHSNPNLTSDSSNTVTTAPTTVDRSPAAQTPVTKAQQSPEAPNSSYTREPMPDPAEQDPWGSPTLHSTHNHAYQQPPVAKTNPVQAPPAVVAGGFGPGAPPEEHEPDDLQAALRAHSVAPRASSAAAWGGYDAPSASQASRVGTGVLAGYGGAADIGGFGGGGLLGPQPGVNRMGSFGGLGGIGQPQPQPRTGARPGLSAGGVRAEESVTITVLPEKEGMFLFQHRNYQISSGRRASRVVRRYSDFVWLLDCLHKRYPFRCLPLLPPKRLAVNGHHLSADATFLENRRRGLIRFTNFLIRHPVLSQEQLVIMFLTVPTELSVWRKQATISVVDEYTSRLQSLSATQIKEIEAGLPANIEQTFETVRSGLRKSAEIYIGLCSLVERLGKRQEGLAGELGRFAQALDGLTDVSEATYAIDTGDIAGLNEGLRYVGRFLGNAQGLLVDESKGWEEGVLEDLKRQRDGLVAMREMFERRERMSGDAVPSLEKRIAAAEKKIEIIKARPDPPASANGASGGGGRGPSGGISTLTGTGGTSFTKEADIKKLEEQIKKDKEGIVECLARRILVKEGLKDELLYFHGSQYHVARMHQDWAQERVKYAELMAENWRQLQGGLDGMPVGE